jgi:hypothetical protein
MLSLYHLLFTAEVEQLKETLRHEVKYSWDPRSSGM